MEDALVERINNILEKYPIQKAYLFGSRARGDNKKDSDVDILVELSKMIGLQFYKLRLELEDNLGVNVDLTTEMGLSKYIKPQILKERKLIYEK